jgi:O-acetyl-ADP-ribose deacetylase (regulator of RNase III)
MRELVVGTGRVELTQGDITDQSTDAIVNAANTTLLGGGGVDGAIHRRGGPAILAECRTLGGCATGDAKITGGGWLLARYVIHAVGPVYRDGQRGEDHVLERAYQRSLETAAAHEITSIAFPSISTGAYRFPIAQAARVAERTAMCFLQRPSSVVLVRFVLFSTEDLRSYAEALAELASGT